MVGPDRAEAEKRAILESWDRLAEQWDERTRIINAWFEPATRRLMAQLALRSGNRVLEVAAGAGAWTPALSREVGPTGRVIATDGAPGMVRLARRNADRLGLRNVDTEVMDGEQPDPALAPLDAIACRQALMFFHRPVEALRSWRGLLRPGGRVAVSVFGPPERNGFLVRPSEILTRWAHPEGPEREAPGGPGPFSLSRPGRLEGVIAEAGLAQVRVERIPCPLRFEDPADLLRFYRMLLGGIVDELPEDRQALAWSEVAAAISGFAGPSTPGAPCELLVGAACRPEDSPVSNRPRGASSP